jgi:hypothetical protein
VNSGTALDVQGDIVRRGEMDALTALITGQNTSARLRSQSQMQSRAARKARVSGNIGALGTVLQGGAQAGWAYSKMGGGKPSFAGDFTSRVEGDSLGLKMNSGGGYGTGLKYKG